MPHYYMFNKPAGYLTAVRDEFKPTVMEFFPKELRHVIHPVGRLDFDTHGLLIFTDDGRVDRALLNPERHVTKRYFFHAIGRLDDEKIAKIESGVFIGDSHIMSKPAKFTLLERRQVRDFQEYFPENRAKRYMKNPFGSAFTAEMEISEGKKHQVKLMIRAIDCRIVYLKRLQIDGITLDPYLEEGKYRPLNDSEMAVIYELEKKLAIAEGHA